MRCPGYSSEAPALHPVDSLYHEELAAGESCDRAEQYRERHPRRIGADVDDHQVDLWQRLLQEDRF